MNLIRVDDRLVHGQVSVGWGMKINPEYMIIAEDSAAADPDEAELLLLGVPDGVKGAVVKVVEAKNFVDKIGKSPYILVLSSLKDALRLIMSGFECKTLNIGGMHDSEGKKEINHYIFAGVDDIKALKEIVRRGVEVVVQDLPSNRKYGPDYILSKWESDERKH